MAEQMGSGGSRVLAALTWKRRAHWVLTLLPDAREASGVWRLPGGGGGGGGEVGSGGLRAASEAARRAKSKMRRYCAANQLNRLGTLTYGGDGQHDPEELRERRGGVLSAAAGRDRSEGAADAAGDQAGRSVPVSVGAAVASGRARPARPLRSGPLHPARRDRAGVAAWVRAHQAAQQPLDSFGAVGGSAARGPLHGGLHGQAARRRAAAAGLAPLRGRAGLPAGRGRAARHGRSTR